MDIENHRKFIKVNDINQYYYFMVAKIMFSVIYRTWMQTFGRLAIFSTKTNS